MSGRAAPRGFTLIEVLVALAIVAIGMAAVLSALSSSANTAGYLRDKTFAQWVALNQIANAAHLGPAASDRRHATGTRIMPGRSWHWRQEVVTTEVPGVVRIDVKVRPKEIKAGNDDGLVHHRERHLGQRGRRRPTATTPAWGCTARAVRPRRVPQRPTAPGSAPGGTDIPGARARLPAEHAAGSGPRHRHRIRC